MVVKSEVFHWYLFDETEGKLGKIQSEYPVCRDSTLKPPQYRQKVLPTRSQCGHICMAKVEIFSSTKTDHEKMDFHKPNVPHIATSVTTNI